MAQRLVSSTLDDVAEPPLGRSLTSVDVYVTSQCNRRCTYCFLPSDFFASGLRMSFDALSGVVAWCCRYNVGEITFLGGEPSLHPSFADMVSHSHGQGLAVRVVTNGARRFRRLMESGLIGPHNLSRVAVSVDTMDETVQDGFRGRGAWRDAMDTVRLLRENGVLFDINVTGVRSVLAGIGELIRFADEQGGRRVNVHWPSSIGLGAQLIAEQIPDREEWHKLVRMIAGRVEARPDFFVEIERGFLDENDRLTGCALEDFSNLQILPDGRAYRCGLLVDQDGMASLAMSGDELRLTRPDSGEELLRSTMPSGCGTCPAMQLDDRRACIYDKVSSAKPV
ncbi:MAG TPA: radical SAM protein [Streptosporangiaceae bacterium]|nr:radical SAM protein [Streptosporangiaceae bacterium]